MRIFLIVLVAVSAGPAAAQPLPATAVEQARAFAECAGRFSALATHQYNFDGRAAEEAEGMRDTFAALLDAVLPDALADGLPPPQAMAWRVDAWAHQAALLGRAAFHPDPVVSGPSERIASARMKACRALLLGA